MFWKSKQRRLAEQTKRSFDDDMRDVLTLPISTQREIATHVRGQIDIFERVGSALSPEAFTETVREMVGRAAENRRVAAVEASRSGRESRDPEWAKYALEESYFVALFLSARDKEVFRYVHQTLVRWSDQILAG